MVGFEMDSIDLDWRMSSGKWYVGGIVREIDRMKCSSDTTIGRLDAQSPEIEGETSGPARGIALPLRARSRNKV